MNILTRSLVSCRQMLGMNNQWGVDLNIYTQNKKISNKIFSKIYKIINKMKNMKDFKRVINIILWNLLKKIKIIKLNKNLHSNNNSKQIYHWNKL